MINFKNHNVHCKAENVCLQAPVIDEILMVLFSLDIEYVTQVSYTVLNQSTFFNSILKLAVTNKLEKILKPIKF